MKKIPTPKLTLKINQAEDLFWKILKQSEYISNICNIGILAHRQIDRIE